MARGSSKSFRKLAKEKTRKSDVTDSSVSDYGDEEEDDDRVYEESCSHLGSECICSVLIFLCAITFMPLLLYYCNPIRKRENIELQGNEHYENGSFSTALSFYQEALAKDTIPISSSYLYIANTLAMMENTEEALVQYVQALMVESNEYLRLPIRIAIAELQISMGRIDLALHDFEEIISVYGKENSTEVAYVHLKLADCLYQLEQYKRAVHHYQEAVTNIKDTTQLALIYYRMGDCTLRIGLDPIALDFYEKARQFNPDCNLCLIALVDAHLRFDNLHKASLLLQESVHWQNHTQEYFTSMFDYFTDRHTLHVKNFCDTPNMKSFCNFAGLIYDDLPKALANLVLPTLGIDEGDRWLDILDLGCGDGQAMLQYREIANYIAGIDISPLAISKAKKQTGLYDQLQTGDFTLYLQTFGNETFDMVVASDSLPYIGDLDQIFAAVHRVLRVDGVFAFSIDLCTSNRLFELQSTTRRFTHSSKYIDQIISNHTLSLSAFDKIKGKLEYELDADLNLNRRSHPELMEANLYLIQKKQ